MGNARWRGIIIIALAILSACSDGAREGSRKLVYETVDIEVAQLIHQELTRQHIRHDYDGEYTLHYEQADIARVAAAIRLVDSRDLPDGRSIGIPNQARLEAIIQDFERAGIGYRVKERSGVSWLTWDENADRTANKIIQKHIDSSISENPRGD